MGRNLRSQYWTTARERFQERQVEPRYMRWKERPGGVFLDPTQFAVMNIFEYEDTFFV